jgi:hypothetical protein
MHAVSEVGISALCNWVLLSTGWGGGAIIQNNLIILNAKKRIQTLKYVWKLLPQLTAYVCAIDSCWDTQGRVVKFISYRPRSNTWYEFRPRLWFLCFHYFQLRYSSSQSLQCLELTLELSEVGKFRKIGPSCSAHDERNITRTIFMKEDWAHLLPQCNVPPDP